MKRLLIAFAALVTACTAQTPPPPQTAPQAGNTPPVIPDTTKKTIIIPAAPLGMRTKTILDYVVHGMFKEPTYDYTPELKEKLTPEALGAAWNGIVAKLGAYKSMGDAQQTTEEGYKVVYVPLYFENGSVRAKMVYDNTNYVAGLFFIP
jgi:hypothetical protein